MLIFLHLVAHWADTVQGNKLFIQTLITIRYICNAAMVLTTGFESFSIFILDCWSIINSIVNDDILNLRLLWLGSGARHSLCVAHFSSYTLAFWLDQQNCFK